MELVDKLLDMLFPVIGSCLVCGSDTTRGKLCSMCHKNITALKIDYCPICGRYYKEHSHRREGNEPLHAVCQDCRLNPPVFFAARSLGPYGGALKEAIYQLKYQRKRSLAQELAIFMSKSVLVDQVFHDISHLVPIPMATEKQKERGFNQAELLALQMSKQTGLPMLDALKRIRNTPRLSNLPEEQRIEVVKGAFDVQLEMKGQNILLVDDVFTTGATSSECAIMLLQAGAKKVGVMTLASGLK